MSNLGPLEQGLFEAIDGHDMEFACRFSSSARQASSSTSDRWSKNAVDDDTADGMEIERAKPDDCGLLRFHAGRSLQQQQSGREEMSDGDDGDDDDELFGSSDSDSGTDAGTDSDTSLKGDGSSARETDRTK